MPLTVGQRIWLLYRWVPLVAFTLMVAGYMFLVSRGLYPQPVPLFYLFVCVVLLFTGYDALRSLRDLISGVALAQEDLLERSWRSRGRGRAHFYGRFGQLGRLRLARKVFFQNPSGQRYRVVYSPSSKIVWALEPPDQRILR